MGQLSLANTLKLCDSLAQQASLINGAFTTLAAGPVNNTNEILGAADIEVQAALAGAFSRVPGSSALMRPLFGDRAAALDAHLGGIGAFLAANNARVAPQFRDYVWLVPAAQVFPPAGDLASFAVSGANAGTYTHIAAIGSQYGPAAVELVTTDVIGASAITVTLTLTKLDGTSVQKAATIAANSAQGATVAVDGGAVAYTNCTAITITGGTAGDQFKVSSVLERAIAL